MIINKITTGYVIQTFDTISKKFTNQEFVTGDECEWEALDGTPVDDPTDNEYLSFDMVQPL
jgi:hypothetical protein